MAASPILTLLYHLEFFQVPVTEYTQKWNKQKTDVQRQLMPRIGVPDIGGMSGTQAFPSRTFVLLTCCWTQDDLAFLSNASSEEEGIFVLHRSLFITEVSQWLSLLNLPGQKQAARSYPHSKKLSKARIAFSAFILGGVLHQQGWVTNMSEPLHDIPYQLQKVHKVREKQSAHRDKWALGGLTWRTFGLSVRKIRFVFLPSCLGSSARLFKRRGLSETNDNQNLRLTACNT